MKIKTFGGWDLETVGEYIENFTIANPEITVHKIVQNCSSETQDLSNRVRSMAFIVITIVYSEPLPIVVDDSLIKGV